MQIYNVFFAVLDTDGAPNEGVIDLRLLYCLNHEINITKTSSCKDFVWSSTDEMQTYLTSSIICNALEVTGTFCV